MANRWVCLALATHLCAGTSLHGLKPTSLAFREPVITMPTGVEMVATESLPRHFDWREVNGRSFVLPDVNQHIPRYCGSCWIHGTVAQLNDRLNIHRGARWPGVMLARQTLLNCVRGENNTEPPGCYGGDAWLIYKHMKHNKVPDETCNTWKAQNQKCEPINICSNCNMPPGYLDMIAKGVDVSGLDYTGGCKPLTSFLGYKVSDFGHVKGELNMMKEIYARGPISCTLGANNLLYGFADNEGVKREGVWVQDDRPPTDHLIEVAGWGETASGLKYWAIRNSWGTYWGEDGWFRMRRGVDQNSVESDCTWAIPTFDDLNLDLQGKVLGDFFRGVHKIKPIVPPLPEDYSAMLVDTTATVDVAPASWSLRAFTLVIGGALFCGSVGFVAGRTFRTTGSIHQGPLLG